MSRKLQPYNPSATDLGWANMMTQILKDGGVFHTSTGPYIIDKAAKTVRLVDPTLLNTNFETFVMHHRHHCVFKAIGWTVHPIIDWDNMTVPDKKDAESN